MMSASVYILTGFLDSGKTTLLSRIIRKRRNRKILVIQFEEGEEELEISPSEYEKYRHLIYSSIVGKGVTPASILKKPSYGATPSRYVPCRATFQLTDNGERGG